MATITVDESYLRSSIETLTIIADAIYRWGDRIASPAESFGLFSPGPGGWVPASALKAAVGSVTGHSASSAPSAHAVLTQVYTNLNSMIDSLKSLRDLLVEVGDANSLLATDFQKLS